MMSDVATQTYVFALTTAITLVGVLLLLVYNNVKDQAKQNARDLAEKASTAALLKAESDFQGAIDRLHQQFHAQVQSLTEKQDREIDWLKDEMNKFADALHEMRRENNQGQNTILQHLHNLTIAIQKA